MLWHFPTEGDSPRTVLRILEKAWLPSDNVPWLFLSCSCCLLAVLGILGVRCAALGATLTLRLWYVCQHSWCQLAQMVKCRMTPRLWCIRQRPWCQIVNLLASGPTHTVMIQLVVQLLESRLTHYCNRCVNIIGLRLLSYWRLSWHRVVILSVLALQLLQCSWHQGCGTLSVGFIVCVQLIHTIVIQMIGRRQFITEKPNLRWTHWMDEHL